MDRAGLSRRRRAPREARRAAGRRRRRRLLAGVQDERGRRWPSWSARSPMPASSPAPTSRSRSTSRPRSSSAAAVTTSRLEKRALSAEQLHAMLLRWIERYPDRVDRGPFAEHDADAMRAFTKAAAGVQVVGDDFFVTSAERVERPRNGACNAVLLKPNQVGTVSETLACWDAAREPGYRAIVSARSGETEDVIDRAPRGRLGCPASSRWAASPARSAWRSGTRPAHRGGPRRQGAALPGPQAVSQSINERGTALLARAARCCRDIRLFLTARAAAEALPCRQRLL